MDSLMGKGAHLPVWSSKVPVSESTLSFQRYAAPQTLRDEVSDPLDETQSLPECSACSSSIESSVAANSTGHRITSALSAILRSCCQFG